MNLPNLNCAYKPGQLFRHIDGGYYQYEKSVLFADNQDELVIYKHLWPFDESHWARRYQEFKARFTPISLEILNEAKQTKREYLQEQIEETRTNRRKNNKI
ncbi:MAG: DUF1653 domain-containing protein [Candidatus Sericytochromatia bacterium]|nr:DUF1653 domain-containing protein [Candidatus Sericytochromatia bacterium]